MTLSKLLRCFRLALFVNVLCSCPPIFAQISHLELGAGNHSEFSDRSSPLRFRYLENVVENLVKTYGTTGVLYLNDIAENSVVDASDHLKNWIRAKGYTINIEVLAGDYNSIALPEKLKTANLGNPGGPQLPGTYDRDYKKGIENLQITQSLIRIANSSETGLTISTHGKESIEVLQEILEKTELLGRRWTVATEGDGFEYRWPNGQTYSQRLGTNPEFVTYRVHSLTGKCAPSLSTNLKTEEHHIKKDRP